MEASARSVYARFGLTLVVNHACNLRCTYCYTGEKVRRRLPRATGQKAIDRAVSSIRSGGALDLAFFGGEPLIEAELILELIAYARREAAKREIQLTLSMTTNGMLDSAAAWQVMLLPEMQLAISHDGLPSVHDRHRVTVEGRSSSQQVEETIARLVHEQKDFRVVMVVRPDSVDELPAGMDFLYERGVRRFDPSLDLWTVWNRADGARLSDAIAARPTFGASGCPIAA